MNVIVMESGFDFVSEFLGRFLGNGSGESNVGNVAPRMFVWNIDFADRRPMSGFDEGNFLFSFLYFDIFFSASEESRSGSLRVFLKIRELEEKSTDIGSVPRDGRRSRQRRRRPSFFDFSVAGAGW